MQPVRVVGVVWNAVSAARAERRAAAAKALPAAAAVTLSLLPVSLSFLLCTCGALVKRCVRGVQWKRLMKISVVSLRPAGTFTGTFSKSLFAAARLLFH